MPFPKDIRRGIASLVVSHLLKDEQANKNLTSKQHVTVIMEIVGQSFGLDISDEILIRQAIQLYKNWIKGVSVPVPFTENRNEYLLV